MKREMISNKIMLLGVDGLDPRLTKKYVEMGIMPNMKKYIERGAAREDLVMLGGHPTVTPPMWTTLATGCYANVHGITGFLRCGNDIDRVAYNLDSRYCKAEPLWNITAEAGLKTLVWHWPGSSWPPTSDNPNLLVVDGTSPGSVGMGTAQVEGEFFANASEEYEKICIIPKAPMEASYACVETDLEVETQASSSSMSMAEKSKALEAPEGVFSLFRDMSQHTTATTEAGQDVSRSSIKPATGWANAPEDAKEFVILFSNGFIRRPALILKNEDGIYDRVVVYKSKKETEPLAVCPLGKMVVSVIDEAFRNDKTYKVNRNMKLLRLAEDGSSLIMYISAALDIENNTCYFPQRLFDEIVESAGYPPSSSTLGRQSDMLISECMIDNWNVVKDWQAKAIHHVIEKENVDVLFSHFHAIDLQMHQFIKHMADRPFNRQPVEVADKWAQEVYIQTDQYLGEFLHFLDEGWTIMIFSDHAQVSSEHELIPIQSSTGVLGTYFIDWGYTVTRIDENGQEVIDWTKTKAVSQRGLHVYINLKGRNKHTLPDGTVIDGIVDPEDKYALEDEIMTKLYQVTSEETGNRVISVALRNRDAVLLGMGGPECGDILYFMAEGHNYDHADCLSTTYGAGDTSVSPFFLAAGKGIKKGYVTDRIIRQIDFAPTVAYLAGVRMPAQCEGAIVYQILEDEF